MATGFKGESKQSTLRWPTSIYRGSTRLHPLFELLANAEARRNQGATRPTHNMALVHKKKNTPYVEYTRGDVDRSPNPVATTTPVTPQSTNDVQLHRIDNFWVYFF